MQKKTIPILLSLMAISLFGIIAIQYVLIRKTIDERQAVIDNNLYAAVENIDEKLSDHQTISFFDNTVVDNLINAKMHMSNIGDSIDHKITIINNLEENSIDFYASVKSLYLQDRRKRILNATGATQTQDDSDWEEIE